MNAAERQAQIKWNIQQNPTSITIQRMSKIRHGGGFQEQETTVGPFVMRLYADGNQSSIKSEIIGTKETSSAYSLLTDETADIQAEPNVEDTFTVTLHGSFTIKAVYPQIVNGILCGYQADLERVK